MSMIVFFFRNLYEVVEVVEKRELVFMNLAAFLALLDNAPFAPFFFGANGLHQPATNVFHCPVSGVCVDMFAPKTVRTMVGIAVSIYPLSTVFTVKVFFCFFKC